MPVVVTRRVAVFASVAALAAVILVAMAPSAAADALLEMNKALPAPYRDAAVVTTPTAVYIIGGDRCDIDLGCDTTARTSDILKFNPVTHDVTHWASLPGPRSRVAAATDGEALYVFGGFGCSTTSCSAGGVLDDIVRVDLETAAATTRGFTLPTARSGASAVWSGDAFYIFGGLCFGTSAVCTDGETMNDVVRVDPDPGSATIVAQFPTRLAFAATTWLDDGAYVFGGRDDADRDVTDAWFFDPATGDASPLPSMPDGRSNAAIMRFDDVIYLAGGAVCPGGSCGGEASASIVRYDVSTAKYAVLSGELPEALSTLRGGAMGDVGFLFGGHDACGFCTGANFRDSIVRFDPSLGAAAPLSHTLPLAISYAATATNGGAVYTFGGARCPNADCGSGSLTNAIMRVDTDGGGSRVMNAQLPFALQRSTAAWANGEFYIFGGERCSSASCPSKIRISNVYAYDPVKDTVRNVVTEMPGLRAGSAAVANGDKIYLFGGTGVADEIWIYDTKAVSFSVSGASFPGLFHSMAATWAGDHALIWGGYGPYCPLECGPEGYIDAVWRYDPDPDTLTQWTTPLPVKMGRAGGAFDGDRAYALGGVICLVGDCSVIDYSDAIIQLDPVSETVKIMSASLPQARHGTTPVFDGRHLWVAGSEGCPCPAGIDVHDTVYRYDTTPSAPTDIVATPAVTNGAVTVTWVPPAANTYSTLTHHEVWAGPNDAALTEVGIVAAGAPPTFLHDELPSGSTWTYRVRAVGPLGHGPFSKSATTALPSGDSITTLPVGFSTGRASTSAVFDGTYAYVFGGNDNGTLLDQVIRFDPATETTASIAALPENWCCGPATIANGAAYLFGGKTAGGNAGEVLRFDLGTATFSTVAVLPENWCCSTAVTLSDGIYVFGGENIAGPHNKVYRFDPALHTFTLVGLLPDNWCCSTAAAVDGDTAYLFGGDTPTGATSNIYRFDRLTATTTVVGALPENWCCASTVYTGNAVYVFGGENGDRKSDRVYRFDPVTLAVQESNARLPEGLASTSAVWTGDHAYIFGGENDDGSTNAIRRFNVAPDAPRDLTAGPGPTVTDIRLSWLAPAAAGSAPVLEYRVHRGIEGDALALFGTATTLTFTDDTCPLGRICTYAVSAVTDFGESGWSNLASREGRILRPATMEEDRTVVAYNDANGNGERDAHESLDPTVLAVTLAAAFPLLVAPRLARRGQR